MNLKHPYLAIYFFLVLICCKDENRSLEAKQKSNVPNIIIIYADDLGYGELGSYGATELKTPNLDKLANGGMRFTNGYSSSATCTPSRYALLTGTYPWRNKGAKILPGTASLIIDTSQTTIPKMLKKKGYHTGIIGKWHLGLGNGNVDWNHHISPGPNEVGFDYSNILAATQDRVPTVYIENGYVVNLDPSDPIEVSYDKNFDGEPTGLNNPELLKMKWHHGHNNSIVNGIPRIGFMRGGESAKWIDEDMADYFLIKVQDYVKKNKDEPFFLFYSLQQPHVPRTPNSRFVGSTTLGPRGDVIVEADWMIGQLIETLKSEKLLSNTLIIFSSDNGPVVNDGYNDDSEEKLGNHTPAGVLRGGKYSLFEAGTRVPFFTYWHGKIKPGISDAMISQLDIFSSLAKLVESSERTDDSVELLDLILGKNDIGREEMIIEATSRTAYRRGNWVMIPPYDGPKKNELVDIELGNDNYHQLYDLAEDIKQLNNIAESNPKKLQELINAYENIRGTENRDIEQLELK